MIKMLTRISWAVTALICIVIVVEYVDLWAVFAWVIATLLIVAVLLYIMCVVGLVRKMLDE